MFFFYGPFISPRLYDGLNKLGLKLFSILHCKKKMCTLCLTPCWHLVNSCLALSSLVQRCRIALKNALMYICVQSCAILWFVMHFCVVFFYSTMRRRFWSSLVCCMVLYSTALCCTVLHADIISWVWYRYVTCQSPLALSKSTDTNGTS